MNVERRAGDIPALVDPTRSQLLVSTLTIDAAGLLLRASSWRAPLVVFGFAFCGVGSMTNQAHQWSHMPVPPRGVRVLQSCGLLLGHTAHAAHHAQPYNRHYCITTGWCNRPLEAVAFFRRLESAITRVTGAVPRQDERRYAQTFGAGVSAGGPRD